MKREDILSLIISMAQDITRQANKKYTNVAKLAVSQEECDQGNVKKKS